MKLWVRKKGKGGEDRRRVQKRGGQGKGEKDSNEEKRWKGWEKEGKGMRGWGKQARRGEEEREGTHRKVVIPVLCGVSLPVRDSSSFLPLLRCYFICPLLHLDRFF